MRQTPARVIAGEVWEVERPESVAAVVLTRNRAASLRSTLHAISGQSRPVDEIVVVDNASEDDTLDLLRQGVPVGPRGVELLQPRGRGRTLAWHGHGVRARVRHRVVRRRRHHARRANAGAHARRPPRTSRTSACSGSWAAPCSSASSVTGATTARSSSPVRRSSGRFRPDRRGGRDSHRPSNAWACSTSGTSS